MVQKVAYKEQVTPRRTQGIKVGFPEGKKPKLNMKSCKEEVKSIKNGTQSTKKKSQWLK